MICYKASIVLLTVSFRTTELIHIYLIIKGWTVGKKMQAACFCFDVLKVKNYNFQMVEGKLQLGFRLYIANHGRRANMTTFVSVLFCANW